MIFSTSTTSRSPAYLQVPPGHYITGKNPKLHQFALTPEELHARCALQKGITACALCM